MTAKRSSTRKTPAQLNREIAEALASKHDLKIGSAVQLRWEPGTGGVIRRFELGADGRACALVATSRGERQVPVDGLALVRKEHEQRVRASAAGARSHSTRKSAALAPQDLVWRDSPHRGAGVLTAQGRGGRGSGYYEIELHQGHTVRYHSPDGSIVLTGPHAGGIKFAKELANDHNRHAKNKRRHSTLSDDAKIRDAISRFPATFGLRGFPGGVFRISPTSSYVSGGRLLLYTQRKDADGWQDFSKGTEAELRGQIVR